MGSVSEGYYEYGDLAPEARGRALETWADWRHRHADLVNEAVLAEDLDFLEAALGSVCCYLAGHSIAYDGSEGRVGVALRGRFGDELFLGGVSARELPSAESGGSAIGAGFAERWNSEDRPALALMLESGRDGAEVVSEYESRAQARADGCLKETLDDLAYFMGEEWFDSQVERGVSLFEEDGTYAPDA